MPINMQDDAEGAELTKDWEKRRLVAYWDALGKVWTIGWGHTGPEVHEGLVWPAEQCDAQLMIDRKAAVDCVNKNVNVAITQPEFRALVDFTFNAGCHAFEGSTMLKLLNRGNHIAAAAEFEKWDHAGGVEVAGLLRRREQEEQIFDSGIPSAVVEG